MLVSVLLVSLILLTFFLACTAAYILAVPILWTPEEAEDNVEDEPIDLQLNMNKTEKEIPVLSFERESEQCFVKWRFGERLLIKTESLAENNLKPLCEEFHYQGNMYHLLVLKLQKNKGGNLKFTSCERKLVKAYYIAVSGADFEPIDLQLEMNKIGDFGDL
jgi:hypothetical protein